MGILAAVATDATACDRMCLGHSSCDEATKMEVDKEDPGSEGAADSWDGRCFPWELLCSIL